MPYSTKDDILDQLEEAILIDLTDDNNTGVVDDSRVARAIADADAEIDSYCGMRYAVPFDPVPDRVRQVSVDIAIYNLYSRRGDTLPEVRDGRHQNAIKFLGQVAQGKAGVGIQPPPEPPGDGEYTGGIKTEVRDKIFDPDKMEKF